MKRLVLVFVAALLLTGCAPVAISGDPNIQAKAEAFETKLAQEKAEKDHAYAESRIINIAMPRDRPFSVFYAGDSLSYGLFSSVEANGYRPLVNAELRKHGEIKEQRATKADEKALFKAGNVQNIPDSGVDLAILELGTNDTTTRTPIDQFHADYVALVNNVRRSPNVQLICVGTWGASGPTITDPYDFEIKKVCEANGGQYVDLTAAFEKKGSYGPKDAQSWLGPSDNFHPNDQGHRAIADLILERIRVV